MRFTGKLHTWNEDRGFGFIRPEEGGQDIFVHVSALPTPRPQPDEVLTFEVGLNREGKKKAFDVRRQQVEAAGLAADVDRGTRSRYRRDPRGYSSGNGKLLQRVIVVVILATMVGYGYLRFQKTESWAPASSSGPTEVQQVAPMVPSFQCDGRQHCSQMTSCEEAKFFLKNCPDTKMDGNHDGVPCEKQWC